MKVKIRRLYVGVDVHHKEHQIAIIPAEMLQCNDGLRRKVRPFTIKNTVVDFERLDVAIKSHISTTNEAAIAVDHTGGHYSEPIVYFLQQRGYNVYHLEAKATKVAKDRLLDEENKSDLIDATAAAYLLYLRDLHGLSFRISAITPELGSEAASIRSLILQRWQFTKLATQATNRLHQLLVAVFPEGEANYFNQLLKIAPLYPTPKDILASNSLMQVEDLPPQHREMILELAASTVGVPGDIYRWLIRDLSIQRMEYSAKIDILTKMIREQVALHPYGRILLSFPYVGAITGGTIIGIIKDIRRWPNKKNLKKALGVYGTVTQTGTHSHTMQGKEGDRRGRRALFQVCLGCITKNAPENDFKDYYNRQVTRGKIPIKALVSAMGKLAEIIYHCLKVGEPYQYQGIYRARKTKVMS